MKLYLPYIAIMFLFTACQSSATKKQEEVRQNAPAMQAHHSAVDDAYKSLAFDNKYDLSCGMPLTAGLSDTAQYKGKLYGFCSAGCKEDFKKNSKKLLSAAKSK